MNPLEQLAQVRLLDGLAHEDLEAILRSPHTRMRHFGADELICRQGAPLRELMILLDGCVHALMAGGDGKQLTIDILHAPELLAPAFLFCSDPRMPVAVETAEPSTVLCIGREHFLQLMGRHESVMLRFLADISDRSLFLSQRLNALSLQSLRERLINHLRMHPDYTRQEDLAQMLGVARPSLGRVITELVKEGILIRSQGRLLLARP